MIPLSVLDLSPIPQGSTAGNALNNSRSLAQHAERLGYRRYWLAEHHNMPGIASAATSVAIAHVAGGTDTIRVGAGGVMLPNHAPLVIAEQFGTLESLFPGRIDLGIGRAPGTDQMTSHALRRTLTSDIDHFPRDVAELQRYFQDTVPGQRVQAVPGAGLDVPLFILGSSLYGAQLAAAMGLPYAFASHFAPAAMMQAIELYREHFKPSDQLDRPHVILGYSVYAADSEAEARLLRSSAIQGFINLRQGTPGPLPPPVEGLEESLPAPLKSMLDEMAKHSAVGTAERVEEKLSGFVEATGADEVIVVSQIFDHSARIRSYEILAETFLDRSAGQAAAEAATSASGLGR